MLTEKEAIKQRDVFLKEHPNLKEYQKRIDDILKKTHPDKRMEVIGMMLVGEQSKLLKNLTDLTSLLGGLKC